MKEKTGISDNTINFLLGSDEDFIIQPFGFESDEHSSLFAIGIHRCYGDDDQFLLSTLQKNPLNPEKEVTSIPMTTLLDILEISADSTPLYDAHHMGPLSSEDTLKFLDIVDAQANFILAHRKLNYMRDAFTRRAQDTAPTRPRIIEPKLKFAVHRNAPLQPTTKPKAELSAVLRDPIETNATAEDTIQRTDTSLEAAQSTLVDTKKPLLSVDLRRQLNPKTVNFILSTNDRFITHPFGFDDKGQTPLFAMHIHRCHHDNEKFLFSMIQRSPEDPEKFETVPMGLLLKVLDIPLDNVSLHDPYHLGPLDAQDSLKLLDLINTQSEFALASRKLTHMRDAFTRRTQDAAFAQPLKLTPKLKLVIDRDAPLQTTTSLQADLKLAQKPPAPTAAPRSGTRRTRTSTKPDTKKYGHFKRSDNGKVTHLPFNQAAKQKPINTPDLLLSDLKMVMAPEILKFLAGSDKDIETGWFTDNDTTDAPYLSWSIARNQNETGTFFFYSYEYLGNNGSATGYDVDVNDIDVLLKHVDLDPKQLPVFEECYAGSFTQEQSIAFIYLLNMGHAHRQKNTAESAQHLAEAKAIFLDFITLYAPAPTQKTAKVYQFQSPAQK